MLNTSMISARDLQKYYKPIIEGVRKKKRVVVLTTNKKPQAAIVSLEDLAKLNQIRVNQANLEMLRFAKDNMKELKNLPANLREKADELLYAR